MLTTDQIKHTVSEYFQDKPVKKVFLFGSYATGRANESSDIDLSVVLSDDAKITYITFAGYLLDLQDRLNRKIDLVEEKMIHKQLRPYVDRSKILLLDK